MAPREHRHRDVAELARRIALGASHAVERIVPVAAARLGLRAPRPRFSALGSARGAYLPSLDDALARYHQEVR